VKVLQAIAKRLDRRLLLVRRGEGCVWAWLGGRREFGQEEIDSISAHWPTQLVLALGDPGQGLAGWRLTHRQAAAALPVAQRADEAIVHYADVALLASALQDNVLATSLRQKYLVPLEVSRDGGAAARETLRAYFAAGGNVSSAAAALGVSRPTVSSRLASIEDLLGQALDAATAEIETALRLDEIEESRRPGG
jgi:DNA-binding PucR family transcriptional regulator